MPRIFAHIVAVCALGGATVTLSACDPYATSAADCAATGAALAGGARMLDGGNATQVVGSALLGAGAGAIADNVGVC